MSKVLIHISDDGIVFAGVGVELHLVDNSSDGQCELEVIQLDHSEIEFETCLALAEQGIVTQEEAILH